MTLLVDVVREGCGETEGDAEPRRANLEARSSVGFGDRVMEELYVVSRLTLLFLSALRRARSSSSTELGSVMVAYTELPLSCYCTQACCCTLECSEMCGGYVGLWAA